MATTITYKTVLAEAIRGYNAIQNAINANGAPFYTKRDGTASTTGIPSVTVSGTSVSDLKTAEEIVSAIENYALIKNGNTYITGTKTYRGNPGAEINPTFGQNGRTITVTFSKSLEEGYYTAGTIKNSTTNTYSIPYAALTATPSVSHSTYLNDSTTALTTDIFASSAPMGDYYKIVMDPSVSITGNAGYATTTNGITGATGSDVVKYIKKGSVSDTSLSFGESATVSAGYYPEAITVSNAISRASLTATPSVSQKTYDGTSSTALTSTTDILLTSNSSLTNGYYKITMDPSVSISGSAGYVSAPSSGSATGITNADGTTLTRYIKKGSVTDTSLAFGESATVSAGYYASDVTVTNAIVAGKVTNTPGVVQKTYDGTNTTALTTDILLSNAPASNYYRIEMDPSVSTAVTAGYIANNTSTYITNNSGTTVNKYINKATITPSFGITDNIPDTTYGSTTTTTLTATKPTGTNGTDYYTVTITPNYTNTVGYSPANTSAVSATPQYRYIQKALFKYLDNSKTILECTRSGFVSSGTLSVSGTLDTAVITCSLSANSYNSSNGKYDAAANILLSTDVTGNTGYKITSTHSIDAGFISSTDGSITFTQDYYIRKGALNASGTASATTTVAPGTVSIAKDTTSVSGKTRLDITPVTDNSKISTYYVAIKATAAANTTGTTSNITGTATAGVATAGYVPSGTTGSGSVSGTATAKTSAKNSSVYYVPIATGVLNASGTASATTTVAPGTVSIAKDTTSVNGKTRIDIAPTTATSGISRYYLAIKATAAANTTGTTSSITGTATAGVATAGYVATTATGSGSVSGTATAKTSAKSSDIYYIPVPTLSASSTPTITEFTEAGTFTTESRDVVTNTGYKETGTIFTTGVSSIGADVTGYNVDKYLAACYARLCGNDYLEADITADDNTTKTTTPY